MKEKKDCKIVQDLLPNYIEKLTNNVTSNFVKDHLQQCEECSKIYENMKKNLELETEKPSTKEINFFKKYRNKLRVLKIILLIIVVIVGIDVTRKFVIISELSSRAETYLNSANYHKISLYWDAQSESYSKVEVFCKGDKIKNIIKDVSKDGTITYIMYGKNKEYDKQNIEIYDTNMYIEGNGEKKAILNTKNQIMNRPESIQDAENWWQILIGAIPASVESANYNSQKCYYIKNFGSLLKGVDTGMYLSKDTGLIIGVGYGATKGKVESGTQDYFYEFGTVRDEDFTEPDISEYKIVENLNE